MSEVTAEVGRVGDPALCRAFRVSDGMIAMVGLAVALASGGHLLPLLAEMMGRLGQEAAAHREDLLAHWPAFRGAIRYSLRNTMWYGLQVTGMFLFNMTPVFLALRLRRPRPPLQDLLRQPGTVACLGMVFGFFWGTGGLVILVPSQVDAMIAAPLAMGGSVAVGWIALALGRRWRSEAGWVDRMGRALGWVAIATALDALLVFRA